MRLFWRIFLSVLTVTMIVFCISGHLLICAFFVSSLHAETELGVRANISFCRSFETAAVKAYGEETLTEEKVQKFIRSVSITSVQENTQFLVTDQNRELLYEMTDVKVGHNEELLRAAGGDATVYTIERAGDKYYLNTAGIAVIGENEYFVQNISDISSVYEQNIRGMYGDPYRGHGGGSACTLHVDHTADPQTFTGCQGDRRRRL